MNLELSTDEAGLLKSLLLAEEEEKRVELHHAKNMEFKAELQAREQLVQGLLKRL
jgi:hypothetical protein